MSQFLSLLDYKNSGLDSTFTPREIALLKFLHEAHLFTKLLPNKDKSLDHVNISTEQDEGTSQIEHAPRNKRARIEPDIELEKNDRSDVLRADAEKISNELCNHFLNGTNQAEQTSSLGHNFVTDYVSTCNL